MHINAVRAIMIAVVPTWLQGLASAKVLSLSNRDLLYRGGKGLRFYDESSVL